MILHLPCFFIISSGGFKVLFCGFSIQFEYNYSKYSNWYSPILNNNTIHL